MFIQAAATISHQPSFRNPGFAQSLAPLPPDSGILHPDYNDFIPAKDSRRLNALLKMAIACAADCLAQVGEASPQAIIVGTSMGCNHFTKAFLDKIIEADGGLVSPTAFILSTHNTIAGQVSLFLGNRSHNMTHTQNSLSFEQALIDGALCLGEGRSPVLVGAADEVENELYDMNARLHTTGLQVSSGASFFLLSADPPDTEAFRIEDIGSLGLIDDLQSSILEFLHANRLSPKEIDLVLYSASEAGSLDTLSELFESPSIIDYQAFSGAYYTNAAFALHYALDLLQHSAQPLRRVLICNHLIPENLGLILLKRSR